ncbi:carbon-nitrogen hydrolase family protein [Streptomyces sp. NPDC020681]|uniref:carbon-nitrogen hydrolase family protein n=1 Tax=Streptomyces sp. NPDC020681 TaxID=3365083 RepID=UPI00378DE54F
MKTAAAQFTPVAGDIESNVHTMRELVRLAAGRGARLVAFGELAATGYELPLLAKDPALWLTDDDPRLDPLREMCRDTSTAALVGCPVRGTNGKPTIASLVIGPHGEHLTRYDKVHLHGEENDIFAAGRDDGRFEIDGVRFATAICYDNRFPELAERAVADNCRVYVASSAHDRDSDVFDAVYPVRARDNGLYVLLANPVGPGGAGDCPGLSAVWGPDGSLLATAGSEAPGLAVADLPL